MAWRCKHAWPARRTTAVWPKHDTQTASAACVPACQVYRRLSPAASLCFTCLYPWHIVALLNSRLCAERRGPAQCVAPKP
eukprot:354773-Chlamydomonas_euryale.AAC.7